MIIVYCYLILGSLTLAGCLYFDLDNLKIDYKRKGIAETVSSLLLVIVAWPWIVKDLVELIKSKGGRK